MLIKLRFPKIIVGILIRDILLKLKSVVLEKNLQLENFLISLFIVIFNNVTGFFKLIIKRTFTRLRNFNLNIVARFPHCFSISGKRWGPGYILDLAAEYVNLVYRNLKFNK